MPHPERLSLEEAVARIPDEATVAFGGFDILRAPMALVFELARFFAGQVAANSAQLPIFQCHWAIAPSKTKSQ